MAGKRRPGKRRRSRTNRHRRARPGHGEPRTDAAASTEQPRLTEQTTASAKISDSQETARNNSPGKLKSALAEDGGRKRRWKMALGCFDEALSAAHYARLVQRGPAPVAHAKLILDVNRTFKHDPNFHGCESQRYRLVRVLNAHAWTRQSEGHDDADDDDPQSYYVQGMNVMAGVLLVAMPELDAFYALERLLRVHLPMYVRPRLCGVYAGARLVHRVIEVCVPALGSHLNACRMLPEMYAFAPIMTMSACTPPLSEVLKLWDHLMINGLAQWNVLAVAAQISLLAPQLLSTNADHPMKILRTLPPINAEIIIAESERLMSALNSGEHWELLDQMVRHAREPVDGGGKDVLALPSQSSKFMQLPMKSSLKNDDEITDALDELVLDDDDDDGDW